MYSERSCLNPDAESLVLIRDGCDGDINLIFATWLRGLYYGNDLFNSMKKDNFMKRYHDVIQLVLNKTGLIIKIAALKEDPDCVLGYSVSQESVLHWVYVKQAWRRLGIAKALCPLPLTACTHLTKIGQSLKPLDCEFDPFLT